MGLKRTSDRAAVLLVHGMGRTPLSMAWLGWSLRSPAIHPRFFGYVAAVESIDRIVTRLTRRLMAIAGQPYIVVGHSLGGVLLRLAVARLPPEIRRPEQMILLASPHRSPRLARRFARRLFYRALTGEAGQLLADPVRMAAVPRPGTAYSVIVGTRGLSHGWSSFGDEPNDGIVAVSEAALDPNDPLLALPRMHTLLMNAAAVRQHIRDVVARIEKERPR